MPRFGHDVISAFRGRIGAIADGNYAEIETDGTIVLFGGATTWRDELGPLIGQRLESPGSDIVQDVAEGATTFKSSARYPTDYVTQTLQLNHDWFYSTVDFHVHYWQAPTAVPNFLAGYRWQINGEAKETAWTLLPLTVGIFTHPGVITLNQIFNGATDITPPVTASLSEGFQVRIYRDYTNASGLFSGAETSGLDVSAWSSDMHRRSNTLMGSREEYSK